jgi:hypothetical protein
MIIDQIQLTGLETYFQNPTTPGDINLGAAAPVAVRTEPLPKGKQMNISGIRLLIEKDDLQDLFAYQFTAAGSSSVPSPLIKVTVMKEMFAGLFGDPFRHRVYNIAGFLDFNEGSFSHCRAMEVDGVPTLVSMGNTKCTWTSKKYELPETISIASIAWELATSRLTTPNSFTYSIKINLWDSANSPISPAIQIGNSGPLASDAPRFIENLNKPGVKYLQVEFSAHVLYDASIKERHLPVITESLGTPLLRAINILEPVSSIYDIYSLTELEALCSDFRLFENPGPEIGRLITTLDLSAVLVNSVNQAIVNNDIYDAGSRYEFIELEIVHPSFSNMEVKLLSELFLSNKK